MLCETVQIDRSRIVCLVKNPLGDRGTNVATNCQLFENAAYLDLQFGRFLYNSE